MRKRRRARKARIERLIANLEGTFGSLRRRAGSALSSLKKEINRRKGELQTLQGRYERLAGLLGTAGKRVLGAKRARKRRGRAISWDRVLKSLPATFTVGNLTKNKLAGKKPKAHLYTALARWKKAGLVKSVKEGYRKVATAPAPRKPARPKRRPAKAAKPTKPGAKPESKMEAERPG